jgi:hypothetical protein
LNKGVINPVLVLGLEASHFHRVKKVHQYKDKNSNQGKVAFISLSCTVRPVLAAVLSSSIQPKL